MNEKSILLNIVFIIYVLAMLMKNMSIVALSYFNDILESLLFQKFTIFTFYINS